MTRWFGTDGVRGSYGQWPMVPDFLLRLGWTAGQVLRPEQGQATMLIGRDSRRSSPLIQQALSAGLLAAGWEVIDLGVIPTPGVAWLVRHLGVEAGAVISASHNPSNENGIKFFSSSGRKLSEEVEEAIERLLPSSPQELAALPLFSTPSGSALSGEAFQELYQRSLLAEHSQVLPGGMRLVVDCANGAASAIAPRLFSRWGVDVVALHAAPDGENINRGAGSEFVRRAPQEMRRWAQVHGARFGLAFDGDADRVVFVDEEGTLIDGDYMLGILAREFDQRGQLLGRAVVTTVMRNSGLKTWLEARGIRLLETPVGDKYVTDKLFELRQQEKEEGSLVGIGGEQAGHIVILDDEHPSGDGLRTALFVLRTFLESGAGSLAEFAAQVEKTPQIIASAYVGQGPRLSAAELEAEAQRLLNGQRGLLRVNLRYSGTEPRFRAMLESDGELDEAALGRLALQVCRRAQERAGVGAAEVDLLNVSRGGTLPIEG